VVQFNDPSKRQDLENVQSVHLEYDPSKGKDFGLVLSVHLEFGQVTFILRKRSAF
jgi:hypothetical protein